MFLTETWVNQVIRVRWLNFVQQIVSFIVHPDHRAEAEVH